MPSDKRRVIVDLDSKGKFTYKDENGDEASEKRSEGSDHDFFTWCTSSGRLHLDWPNGHPFSSTPPDVTQPGCFAPSVQVVVETTKDYKYNVTLTDGSGTDHHDDPKIIITAGFGDFWVDLALVALSVGAGFWFVRRRFFS